MVGRQERGKELTDLQRLAIGDIEALLVCGFVESDGGPEGRERYKWTRDADNFRMVLGLGVR